MARTGDGPWSATVPGRSKQQNVQAQGKTGNLPCFSRFCDRGRSRSQCGSVKVCTVALRRGRGRETHAARKCAFLQAFLQIWGEGGGRGLPGRATPPQFAIHKAMEESEMRRLQKGRAAWPNGTVEICQMNSQIINKIAKMPKFVQRHPG